MKKLVTLVILSFASIVAVLAHVEIIGEFLLETDGQKLLLTATLEKRHHTLALMNEADCQPKEMMQKCGSQYLLDHYSIYINDQPVQPTLTNTEIHQNHVVYSFQIDTHPGAVKDVRITSDYIMKYNDHAVLRTAMLLYDRARSFDINKDRNTITAHY